MNFKNLSYLPVFFILFQLFSNPVFAGINCTDKEKQLKSHPSFTVFPGSTMCMSTFASFEVAEIPVIDKTAKVSSNNVVSSRQVNGKSSRFEYVGPKGISAAEIFMNYREAIIQAGFKLVNDTSKLKYNLNFYNVRDNVNYYGADNRLNSCSDSNSVMSPAFHLLGEKNVGSGQKIYFSFYALNPLNNSSKSHECYDRSWYYINIVEPKTVQTGKVTVTAKTLAAALAKNGRVEIKNIEFEFGKSTLKPVSKKSLNEVVKLLKSQKSMKVYVVGHTDNKGNVNYNLKLSKSRASSVSNYLIKNGITKGRLISYGVGPFSPKNNNSTDIGRAKNRRVELVHNTSN